MSSVVVGNMASRMRIQIAVHAPSAQRTANLYEFSRKIAAAASLDDVLWAAVHHVASTLQSPCAGAVAATPKSVCRWHRAIRQRTSSN